MLPQTNITFPAIFQSNITQPVLSPVEIPIGITPSIAPLTVIPSLLVPLPTVSPSYTAEMATDEFGNSFQLVSQVNITINRRINSNKKHITSNQRIVMLQHTRFLEPKSLKINYSVEFKIVM